ncbi:copper chaperone PCu(A)C [Campylobacter jejuni]|uniref:copper chaperone PCu(A)C n=1 Tax=Campylobacter jejuni TaxID=197 RepID=UPI0013B74322|nr:copper chaperone PCu(A)C [Campylobacter jejuni]ECO3688405.1 copper chaperone PCu(A)C [Campylobacter jejuni]EDP6866064.1 copper chaperone PCu(A)C [Campylobacter jejuni]EEC6262984.1 copper chaperone PCu(A)C [Campylobacter jejuni]EKE9380520.1 copper chaperone PCu(A)C [Campylobacter jejuni]
MKKILLLGALFAVNLWAVNDIEVKNAFVKQIPPHAQNSAIFLTIFNNTNKDIALISAKSDISEVSELHTHIHKDGKMMMQKIPEIIIKAHSSTELKSGGYHIMLLKLKKPIIKDTKVNLDLKFNNHKTIELKNIDSKEF